MRGQLRRRGTLLAGATAAALIVVASAGAAIITQTDTPAGAATMASAIASDPTIVTGASWVAHPGDGPNAIATAPLGGFPTDGPTFGIMTTGNAQFADGPNTSGSTGQDDGGPAIHGNTSFDVSILAINLNVPSNQNCLTLDFKFLSDEYPEYVGTAYNDAFIAEIDNNTWSTNNSNISAPDNFAFDSAGHVVSINSSGAASMSAANSSGTTYDGGTPLLSASSPVSPGAHTLYLSIFDQGDRFYDSAVFLDNLSLGFVPNQGAQCVKGAQAVPKADLGITKSDSPDPVNVGANLTYSITAHNYGPDAEPAAQVSDQLPAGTTYVSSSASQGTCAYSALPSPNVQCGLGSLASGDEATVQIVVTPTAPGVITNTAEIGGQGQDLNAANNTASAQTTVNSPQADLSVTKTDSADPVYNGDTVTYTVAETNNGPADAANATMNDVLPASGATLVSVTGPGTCVSTLTDVTCSDPLLTAGSTDTYTIVMQTTAAGTLSDTATVSSDAPDNDLTNNSATETTTVLPSADLSVTKSDNPDPVPWGADVTYTITVTNNGPDGATGVEVVDGFSGPGTYVSGSGPGGPCTVDGGGEIHCPVGSIPAGGSAIVTIVIHADSTGTISDKAGAQGNEHDPNLNNNGAGQSTDVGAHTTTLSYTGDHAQDYNDPATLSATLTDTSTGSPIAGATVSFALNATESCSGTTTATGSASCSVTPGESSGTYTVAATYAGNSQYEPSSTSAPFAVTREETTTTYTGPTTAVANGSTVTLSGVLKEDGTSPIAGRTLTLTIGTQSCTATTNGSGSASCSVTVAQPVGPSTVSASFAGDGYYRPSADAKPIVIFSGLAGGGAFVIGDQTSQAGPVTFWGAQWWKLNTLSGGAGPASFKGFAAAPSTPGCNIPWKTAPGNSPPPPAGPLPAFMGVIVASSIDKDGNAITGNTVHVVVVQTQPGYSSDPGHAGTGIVVAKVC
jgi:uncharacterized repeat protein (TIGR01451 family)